MEKQEKEDQDGQLSGLETSVDMYFIKIFLRGKRRLVVLFLL